MRNTDIKILELLDQNWTLLKQSLETLILSVDKVKSIGIKSKYSFEEMESFDSLTSKFNRTSDIFTQKVLRTTWVLLHEESMPFIDLANKAEKINLISSSDLIIEIRDIRNQIAHEYIPEAIQDLIPEVIKLSGDLADNIDVAEKFLKNRKWIS